MDTVTSTNGAGTHPVASARVEPPNLIGYVAVDTVRGALPVSPIVGPFDVYYLDQPIGSFLLQPTASNLVARLKKPKPTYFCIAAIMAPDENGAISTSALVSQAAAGKLRFRYLKLTSKLKSRFEEAEALCDLQGASPEHMYFKALDVSRPSGDGRQIEFVELSYGGILPPEVRTVVPSIRKQVAQHDWEPSPLHSMSIEEVMAHVVSKRFKEFDYEGFDESEALAANTLGA